MTREVYDKFYFQENTDEGESFQVDEYIDTIKLDNYNYDTSKLLVLKDNVSNEDYDKVSSNQNLSGNRKSSCTPRTYLARAVHF